jgi:TatD DNase family protein
LYINIHTHAEIYDAKIELVNLDVSAAIKPNYYSYGIHPWNIKIENYPQHLEKLKLLATEKRCLAIGECGLDKLSKVDFDLQKEVFAEQIKIANQLQKPLIIHCVKAFNELINSLNLNNNKMSVIVHGFNNNENIAKLLVDNNCFFSFGKALLSYDSNAAKALKIVGRKNFFLETDDADVSIKYIYKKASEILSVAEDILIQQLMNNFEAIFKLKL